MKLKAHALHASALMAVLVGALTLTNCGGGGGSSAPVLYYPYETVYGDICASYQPVPGCTFLRSTGERIVVTEDPAYSATIGSDNLYWVQFDSSGTVATVYYPNSTRIYDIMNISEFAGYVGGTFVGVGTTGLFWEDVRNGQYWWGDTGILYNANWGESNYGRAINNQAAGEAADTNMAAAASEANDELVEKGAEKLMAEYGFQYEKAHAVASALSNWALAAADRRVTTAQDMDETFTSVFGVKFSRALAAVNKYRTTEDKTMMKDLVMESADALGLRPEQAQRFIKGMYGKAAASVGIKDIDLLN